MIIWCARRRKVWRPVVSRHYEFVINGVKLIADVSGALYRPDKNMLIVADLHFEKASAFAARGVALPPYDTAATLRRLADAFNAFNPQSFVSLGDAFHDDDWPSRMSQADRAELARLTGAVETVWVTGNHDPTPPIGLPGAAIEIFRDADLVMRHEPLARGADFEAGELAGHLHPCAKLRQRGRNLRRRCFVHDAQRVILPAFGTLTGSLNVRDVAFDGLFDGTEYQAVMVGAARLAAIQPNRLLPDRAR
ncbi:MAG: ligase-associated DNA damage response endonuclease PdeM [Alphaproteobacteria bacterium]|nr:ligase-associated DNA damage response endonuclease PdeM [Alphaproteobacteria bacterium]